MSLGRSELAYASVSHEFGGALVTDDHPWVSFGRSAGCTVPIGVQPVADVAVPRLAGRLVAVTGDRIAVENLGATLAFDVIAEGEPAVAVRPHALYGPPGLHWTVQVSGAAQSYDLVVDVLTSPQKVPPPRVAHGREPATLVEPDLTARQWRVLAAYVAPLRSGRVTPATHAQVADELGWAKATVRIECNAIWNKFLLAGVPMREFRDKRDAIVDAATRHHLMP